MKILRTQTLSLSALHLIIFINNPFFSSSASTFANTGDQIKYQFVKPVITFVQFPGLEFRVSEPYISGTDQFAIAMELKNNSGDELTSLSFKVKLFDKQGKLVSESLNSCGPLTFLPASGKTLPAGYKGIYDKFCTRDKNYADSFGKVEIELIEIEIAPKGLYDNPVFESERTVFEGFPGLEFRISKPFQYLDALSGQTYFAIAIEFTNKTKKPVKFLNFSQKVYDDQGLLVDREVQNHNQMYEPFEVRDEKFPGGYSGINKTFYVTDLKFAGVFQNIEYTLLSVEY